MRNLGWVLAMMMSKCIVLIPLMPMQCLWRQHAYAYQGQSFVDVAEIMGGEGRTTQVLVRRGYDGGENFDCVIGCDLMRADDEQRLYDYIDRYKPRVLVMAPQCTGMAGWGRFNAVMNPEAHRRSERISHHLGTICAKCAMMQKVGWQTLLPRTA